MKIRAKLLIGCRISLALMILTGIVGWSVLNDITAKAERLDASDLQATAHLANADRGRWQLRYGLAQFMVLDAKGREQIRSTPVGQDEGQARGGHRQLPDRSTSGLSRRTGPSLRGR